MTKKFGKSLCMHVMSDAQRCLHTSRFHIHGLPVVCFSLLNFWGEALFECLRADTLVET